MRIFAIATALALAALLLAPAAQAHWDSSSTTSCPPNDIRWWFEHWHKDCCPPIEWCKLIQVNAPVPEPYLP